MIESPLQIRGRAVDPPEAVSQGPLSRNATREFVGAVRDEGVLAGGGSLRAIGYFSSL